MPAMAGSEIVIEVAVPTAVSAPFTMITSLR